VSWHAFASAKDAGLGPAEWATRPARRSMQVVFPLLASPARPAHPATAETGQCGSCCVQRCRGSWQSRFERGQHKGADAVACEVLILIAGVFDPRLSTQTQPLAQVGASDLQPRTVPLQTQPLPARRHARQSRQATTAGQGNQQSFDLVIGMLGHRHIGHIGPGIPNCTGDGLVTGLTSSLLRALARSSTGVYMLHRQRHLKALTEFAAKRFKFVGRSLQAMVNMDRPHLAWPTFCTGDQ